MSLLQPSRLSSTRRLVLHDGSQFHVWTAFVFETGRRSAWTIRRQKKLATGRALIRYFCTPCTPTKTNGGRTRNLPKDDPEKWQQFIEYNRRDVETEMVIEESLSHLYSMPEEELHRYWLDQRIADKGIGVDMDLVGKILAYGEVHQKAVADEALQLSGCPISAVAQLKARIEERTGKRLLA